MKEDLNVRKQTTSELFRADGINTEQTGQTRNGLFRVIPNYSAMIPWYGINIKYIIINNLCILFRNSWVLTRAREIRVEYRTLSGLQQRQKDLEMETQKMKKFFARAERHNTWRTWRTLILMILTPPKKLGELRQQFLANISLFLRESSTCP